jgi:hypothetical protein
MYVSYATYFLRLLARSYSFSRASLRPALRLTADAERSARFGGLLSYLIAHRND